MFEVTCIFMGSLIKMTTPSKHDAVRFYQALSENHRTRLWIIGKNKRRYLVR